MEYSSTIAPNEFGINIPFQNILCDPEILNFYQELVISILEVWSKGQYLNLLKKGILWKVLIKLINRFIYDADTESINFSRCLAAGALIFTLNSSKVFIYLNPSIFQMLFQFLPNCLSYQSIFRKSGEISQLKADQIYLSKQFQNFLSDLAVKYPESYCDSGWTLHEMKIVLSNTSFANSIMDPDLYISDEKVLDSIIDDSENDFSQLVLQHPHDNLNKQFFLINYKLPAILNGLPSLADLCCFFNAQKCLSILCDHIQGGFNSKQMVKVDMRGRTLLHFAAAGGSNAIIEILLQAEFSINTKDNDGFTPLHYSTIANNVLTFQCLLKNGANVLLLDDHMLGSIFRTAYLYDSYNIIEFIDSNASLIETIKSDISKFKKNNCLIISCKNGNNLVLKFILKKLFPYRVGIRNFNDILFDSFMCACQNGSLDCVKSILIFNSDLIKSNLQKEKIFVSI